MHIATMEIEQKVVGDITDDLEWPLKVTAGTTNISKIQHIYFELTTMVVNFCFRYLVVPVVSHTVAMHLSACCLFRVTVQ